MNYTEKKRVIVATLFRDNEAYIPYYLQCCKSIELANAEFSFHYYFYTNNNADKTAELLNDQNVLHNVHLTIQNQDSNHMQLPRTDRLAMCRENQLRQLQNEEADFFVMIDTEIMFNGNMIKELLATLEKTDADFISPFTVTKLGFYYDTFAHLSIDNVYMKQKEQNIVNLWRRHLLSQDKEVLEPVRSAFGGLFIGYMKHLKNPDLSYLSDKRGCEHLVINKSFYDLGLKMYVHKLVTPLSCSQHDYKRYFSMVSSNEINYRKEILKIYNLVNFGFSELFGELVNLTRKSFSKKKHHAKF